MKNIKCIKCDHEFPMPDNFYGHILCESCDPFMQEEETKNGIKKLEEENEKQKSIIKELVENLAEDIQHYCITCPDDNLSDENNIDCKECPINNKKNLLNEAKEFI